MAKYRVYYSNETDMHYLQKRDWFFIWWSLSAYFTEHRALEALEEIKQRKPSRVIAYG